MVKVKEDLTGRTFGRLTVIRQAEDYVNPNTGDKKAQWLCECSCEEHKQIIIKGDKLKRKNGTRSCGCLRRDVGREVNKKENKFDLISKDYAIGYTRKGEPFWFDKEDYELVKQYCWYYDNGGYVVNRTNHNTIQLHRLVMGVDDKNIRVDHINHPPRDEHKVDNRKSNLRLTTASQNTMNSIINSNNTSGKTGVSWYKSRNKWEVYIWLNKKKIRLGYFSDKEEAIAVREEAEKKYFGEYRYHDN